MKNLILLRHGKSDWGSSHATDHDRPLAARGQSAARLIGTFLKLVGPLPELILTSSALRAQATAELAKNHGKWPSEVVSSDVLYEADLELIVRLVQQQEDSIETLLLVGHNPTWEGLAQFLIGGGTLRFPTGALSLISFAEDSWSQIDRGRGTMLWLVIPKQLKKLL